MNTSFQTNGKRLQTKYEQALEGLKKNVRLLSGYSKPVLQEGGMYEGIWLECGPQEGMLWGEYQPEIARNNHEVFFDLIDPEGYLPALVNDRPRCGHLQTVVPIARTVLETMDKLGFEELLPKAYEACARYDVYLTTFRNSRRTDLVESHCPWDTGHARSPRHAGQGDHCPDFDTKRHLNLPQLPVLAPDLSANKYGGRLALAEMARRLGKNGEADQWLEKADSLRKAIWQYTFDEKDRMFYDLDNEGHFIRVKSDAFLRVLQEKVPTQQEFDELFEAHVINPKEFWTPYPFPSIAADDPAFDWKYEPNHWAGPGQALLALRTPLWLEPYGKWIPQRYLMEKWIEAILENEPFQQQMNPFSGEFNTTEQYSPCMLVLTDFIARLYGIKYFEGKILWGTHLARGGDRHEYQTIISGRKCRLKNHNGCTTLLLNGRELMRVFGEARVETDLDGNLLAVHPTGCGRVIVEKTSD